MTKYCKCGCGIEIPENNTWVKGHNNSDPKKREKQSKTLKGRKHSDVRRKIESKASIKRFKENPVSDATCEKQSKSATKRFENPLEREKASKAATKRFGDLKEREKASDAANKRWEDPLEHEKISNQICMHHYIYDFNDLDKYTISVTRSEHTTIHNNLRAAGLEVPHINILKED